MSSQSLFVEFQQHSTDFLRLLGDYAKRAERSKTTQIELATMEFFWDGTEAIFRRYEDKFHELRLVAVAERVKVKALEYELCETYRCLSGGATEQIEILQKLLQRSVIHKPEDIKLEVEPRWKNVRPLLSEKQFEGTLEKYKKREIEIETILDHFRLTDQQLFNLSKSRINGEQS